MLESANEFHFYGDSGVLHIGEETLSIAKWTLYEINMTMTYKYDNVSVWVATFTLADPSLLEKIKPHTCVSLDLYNTTKNVNYHLDPAEITGVSKDYVDVVGETDVIESIEPSDSPVGYNPLRVG